MASSTSKFVAGHYTAAFTGGAANPASSLDIGTTETGFSMRYANYREDIRIDDYGDTIVDGIFRGFNCYLNFELVKWVDDIDQILQPHYAAADVVTAFGDIGGYVGWDWQSLAGSLVLTPVANINANLKTYTYHVVIPEADHGAWNFSSRLRRSRCNFLCLPDITSVSEGQDTRIFTVS